MARAASAAPSPPGEGVGVGGGGVEYPPTTIQALPPPVAPGPGPAPGLTSRLPLGCSLFFLTHSYSFPPQRTSPAYFPPLLSSPLQLPVFPVDPGPGQGRHLRPPGIRHRCRRHGRWVAGWVVGHAGGQTSGRAGGQARLCLCQQWRRLPAPSHMGQGGGVPGVKSRHRPGPSGRSSSTSSSTCRLPCLVDY